MYTPASQVLVVISVDKFVALVVLAKIGMCAPFMSVKLRPRIGYAQISIALNTGLTLHTRQ
jgi:hypothetical protein